VSCATAGLSGRAAIIGSKTALYETMGIEFYSPIIVVF